MKYSFTPNTFYRHGAGAARGAHNSEVTRSKRVAGIIINSHRCIKALRAPFKNTQDQQNTYRCSSAAERLKTSFAIFLTFQVCFVNGYRLISGRSQDRNLSPVTFQFGRFTETAPCVINAPTYYTALAQRQSARLITWRSSDQNPQAVVT